MSRGSVLLSFLLGILVASLVAAVVVWKLRGGDSEHARADLSGPTVVRQVQRLQRLETVVFGLDKIVAGGQDSRYLPRFLVGDRLLLVVYGEVTAGVDLGRIDAKDVVVNGPAIRITLPGPEIFATRIDNERTRIYSRETGLFTRVDPHLESDVRREAERQIRQAALANGVLEVAATNARATITSFLRGLGFEQAEVH